VQIAGCVLAETLTTFLAMQQLIVGVRGAIWATHLCTYQRLMNEEDACHVVTAPAHTSLFQLFLVYLVCSHSKLHH